jgi:hypothetical protein
VPPLLAIAVCHAAQAERLGPVIAIELALKTATNAAPEPALAVYRGAPAIGKKHLPAACRHFIGTCSDAGEAATASSAANRAGILGRPQCMTTPG